MHDDRRGEVIDIADTLRLRLADETVAILVEEARLLRPIAERIFSDVCELETDGAVNGRGSCLVSGPREALREFHSGSGLAIAREFAGGRLDVFPTRASYIFYDAGDYSFFHNDAVHAHITVLVGLSAGLIPLRLYPEFGRASRADVDHLNEIAHIDEDRLSLAMFERFGTRGLHREAEVLEGHALAIRGRRVAHARPRQPIAGAVVSACYSFLQPPREWQLA